MNLLYPRISRQHWGQMLGLALAGGLVGGLYGIANDQITCTIAPEYFTKLKFQQFAWADVGLPFRLHVAEIGFLAAGAVGFFAGWILARIAVPAWPRAIVHRRASAGFAIMLAFGIAGGITGWLLGSSHDADYSNWQPILSAHHIQDSAAFVHVAYIHNAGYLGALAGLLVTFAWLGSLRLRDYFKK